MVFKPPTPHRTPRSPPRRPTQLKVSILPAKSTSPPLRPCGWDEEIPDNRAFPCFQSPHAKSKAARSACHERHDSFCCHACPDGCPGALRRGTPRRRNLPSRRRGRVEAILHYGTIPVTPLKVLHLLYGDTCVGDSTVCRRDDEPADWSCSRTAAATVHLPAGRHVLKICLLGAANLASLELRKL